MKRVIVGVLAALLIVVGAGGCGQGVGPAQTVSGEEATAAEGPRAGSPGAAAEDGQELDEVKLWFMAGEQFLPLEREVQPAESEPGAAAGPQEATEALLEGPKPSDQPLPQQKNVEPVSAAEATTSIPAGTELVEIKVDEQGEAVVELTPRFLEGIPKAPKERSAADQRVLSARVGQVVHTVTQFAGISSAEIRTGGIAIADDARRADYTPPQRPKPRPAETLRPGAERSPATRLLQQRLSQLGYLPRGVTDGIYGDQTTQAVMAFQAWEGLDRDGIAGPATHAALKQAKRPRPSAEGPRRRVEIHLDKGVVLLVRRGRTLRAIHASGGAPGYDTPRGTFEVFRKELMSWSVPYSVWMPYASYFNGGIALHESGSVPAYPASHGCVRVPPSESKLVYNFAGMGTTVVVL